VFWVISVYFNIRNTLPKSGTFLLGHPVYIYIYIYIYTHTQYIYVCVCVYMLKHAALRLCNIYKGLACIDGYYSYICVSSSQWDAPLKSVVDLLVKSIPRDAKFTSPGTADSFTQPNHLHHVQNFSPPNWNGHPHYSR